MKESMAGGVICGFDIYFGLAPLHLPLVRSNDETQTDAKASHATRLHQSMGTHVDNSYPDMKSID